MKKILSIKSIKENIQLIILLFVAFVLRFINLGYSDFQGDEIKALYLPLPGQPFFEYIMDQRKGPVQFIITYLLKIVDPMYNNQFLIRLPFAIAGFLAVYFFFRFVEMHFGKKIAFYASFFMATNGFFVAFSRIVQYQSFVILFAILSLYFLSLASKNEKYNIKGIYLGLIFWALSILSHYDGVFIAPFVFYLLFKWFKDTDISKKQKITHFIISGVLSSFLLLSFYVPFAMFVSDKTKDYWASRITGEESGKVSSSKYLFTVYQPIYVIHIYLMLFAMGVLFIGLGLSREKIHKMIKVPDIISRAFRGTTDLMSLVNEEKLKIACLLLWIGLSVVAYEFIIYLPGTHIYNYILPSFIVLAFGFVAIESFVFKVFEANLVKILNFLGVFMLFGFLTAQTYAVFVDNRKEYPWEEEKFLIWTFPKPSVVFHLSMFGFPYFRDWEGIRDFVSAHPEVDAYTTNERKSIARYYVGLEKGSDTAGFYVHVKNPQSFTNDILSEKAAYWTQHYEPIHTLTRDGRDFVRIYIMAPGTLEEVVSKGY
ncbi:MAG: glycosyltransferase family 39 protein [Patescibacteria group bacterium]